MNTIEVLKAARELISNPARWTQGAFAKDVIGKQVAFDDPSAVCWCARGAMYVIGDRSGLATDGWRALRAAIQGSLDSDLCVSSFNDSHTHAEVLALFDATIARLEAGHG